MNCEHEYEYGERLSKLEAKVSSNTHRIDKLESISEAIYGQSENIAKLTVELKRTNDNMVRNDDKMRDHERRIAQIERAPLSMMEKLKVALLSGAATAVASAAIALLIG